MSSLYLYMILIYYPNPDLILSLTLVHLFSRHWSAYVDVLIDTEYTKTCTIHLQGWRQCDTVMPLNKIL